jgi:hypothetical protein
MPYRVSASASPLPSALHLQAPNPPPPVVSPPDLQLARASGARVVAVQFADRQEASTGALQPGNRWIAQALQQEGVPSVQAGPIFRDCGPIDSLYSDGIHPYTAAGQACLAKAIRLALGSRWSAPHASGRHGRQKPVQSP